LAAPFTFYRAAGAVKVADPQEMWFGWKGAAMTTTLDGGAHAATIAGSAARTLAGS